MKNVRPFLKTGGFLIITSCNWTNDELKSHFVGSGRTHSYRAATSFNPCVDYELHSEVKQPSFKFGGQVGQTIATVGFRAV